MSKRGKYKGHLTDEDVTLFLNVLGVSTRQMERGRRELTKRYDLGPRGAWMLGMISHGLNSPSKLSDAFCTTRSLMTAELNRLISAGLVVSTRDASDGRRLTLSLTKEGRVAEQELQIEMSRFVNEQLAGYTREEVQFCSKMIKDFSEAESIEDLIPRSVRQGKEKN